MLAGAKETARITREPGVWVERRRRARGGGGADGAGLHRPLLGKRQRHCNVPSGTSRVLGQGVGVLGWTSRDHPPPKADQVTGSERTRDLCVVPQLPQDQLRCTLSMPSSEAFPQQAPISEVCITGAYWEDFVHHCITPPVLTGIWTLTLSGGTQSQNDWHNNTIFRGLSLMRVQWSFPKTTCRTGGAATG